MLGGLRKDIDDDVLIKLNDPCVILHNLTTSRLGLPTQNVIIFEGLFLQLRYFS